MDTNDKDLMRELFAELPEEQLPVGLNEKIMLRVHEKVSASEKYDNILAICGYVFGAAAMLAACVFVFYKLDFSLPEMSFQLQKPDFHIFKSPSFYFSIYIGILATILLLIDNLVHRYMKTK